MILTETLTKALKLYPRKQAIVCGEKRWTYEEFGNRINRLSHALNGFGVKKDDKVAILLPNCHIFLEAYYAIPLIGAISVPINYRLSSREIAFILQDSESKILVADSIFKNRVDPIREEIRGVERILWTGGLQELEDSRDLNYEKVLQESNSGVLFDPFIHDDDIAQIYYTSGTTCAGDDCGNPSY
jgi:fatty-acyl-CoA synthase